MKMSKLNVKDELQDLSPIELKKEYDKIALPFAVGCINLSGEINIGMMLRTASIFGASKFIILGRRHYDHRSAVGTHHHIPVERILTMKGANCEFLDEENLKTVLFELQKTYSIIFIEQSEKSLSLNCMKDVLEKIKKIPLFLFGSESEGIPKSILDIPDTFCLFIEQPGIGRSLNVSITCGIVLHTCVACLKIN